MLLYYYMYTLVYYYDMLLYYDSHLPPIVMATLLPMTCTTAARHAASRAHHATSLHVSWA